MPITIKEIIASDTISQLVDKTNFNFDQLLLNGGGPLGPAGAIGPTGPAGGRGEKGTTWYDGTDDPNVTAPTATPLKSDYYLQDSGTTPPTAGDGDVWEYTGLTWTNTGVNILGPAGPSGASGGFGKEFGGPSQITKQTARYNGPIGLGNGATTGQGGNEGVPSVMIGGVVSNTQQLAGIPLTAAYVIPDTIATTLISTTASLMIHQKDSSARGIIFHGGNAAGNNDSFEQNSIGQLSGIFIGTDDKLVLDVPKVATTPSQQTDLIGFELNVPNRSHVYTAGKEISFQTGTNNTAQVSPENSNFSINVGNGSNAGGNKFSVQTSGTAGSSLLDMGAGFTDVSNTTRVGQFQIQAGKTNIVTSTGKPIHLLSGGSVLLSTTFGTNPAGSITNSTGTGAWTVNTGGGSISLNQNSATVAGDITIQNLSTQTGGDIRIQSKKLIVLKDASLTSLEAPSIVIDQTGNAALQPFTRFVGKQTIADTGLSGITYPGTDHNTLIYKEPETVVSAPNAIMELTGTAANVDYAPGIMLQAWTGGLQNTSDVSAGLLAINLGQEGPVSPVPAGEFLTFDNSLGYGVRSSDNSKDYFNASRNKIGIATPIVYKRVNDYNSSINSNPNFTSPGFSASSAPQTLNYGWNTNQLEGPSNFQPNVVTEGMPTTEQLDVPFLSLNFGPGLGFFKTGNTNALNNNGYSYSFNFPIGSYPGQKLLVKMYVQANSASWQLPGAGGPQTITNFGEVEVRIPKYRVKVPASGGTFTDWWAQGGNPPTTQTVAGYTAVAIPSAFLSGSQIGLGRFKMIEMVWDGQYITQRGVQTNINGLDGKVTQIQMGWCIINDVNSTTNIRAVQTGGTGPTSGCFIAGTLISLGNGDHKNIEDVSQGETVITYNETTGLNETGIVGSVTAYQVPRVIKLIFVDGTDITTTSEHPFFIEGKWIKASELQLGHNTYKLNGSTLAISEIELIEEAHTVYNLLDVGDNHNFYVNETLVHNLAKQGL